ncbi:serine hydrolase domain-containing protein [Butyricimonas muris]|uniref:serine hydrolase domain-containing protein n=1 Tax=Butyricimonas muris TaxID=3378067 RepID=UPI0039674B5E
MKYTILLILIFVVLITIPWKSHPEKIQVEEIPPQDTLAIAIHDLFTNEYSDLDETKRLDNTIERFMRQWEIKGASLAIMKDGKLIYSKGYGYADEENGIKTDVNHIFRIASVSKLITAAGIMKLVENGKLSLDDKVFGEDGILNDTTLYYPIKDKRAKNITVENLLRHQGGFTARYGDPMFNPVDIAKKMDVPAPADLNTVIKFVLSRRLGFTPGTSTNYSNVGYGILTKIIEQVAGEDYERFIQDNILIPAGCYDMHLAHNLYEERYLNEVRYYEQADADLIRACDGRDTLLPRSNGGNNIEALSGAGGWVASPTELLCFLAAIDGDDSYPDVLSQNSINTMVSCPGFSLPIGWMKTNGRGDWLRSGTLAGTSAMLKRQHDGFCWAFVTNTSNWTGPHFPQKIESMVYQAMNRVKEWPDRNLFDPAYCKNFHDKKKLLADDRSTKFGPPLPGNI